MNCPKCEVPLRVSHRQSVETDVCDQCRGVWLDRGELDKIINRYEAFDRDEERTNYDEYLRRDARQPKRKSFWQDMFD